MYEWLSAIKVTLLAIIKLIKLSSRLQKLKYYDIIAMITKHIIHYMNSLDIQRTLTEVWITYHILCYIIVWLASIPCNRFYSKVCSVYIPANISMHENMRHLWPKSAKYLSVISFWCWISIGLHNRHILWTNSLMKACESYDKFCGILVHIYLTGDYLALIYEVAWRLFLIKH